MRIRNYTAEQSKWLVRNAPLMTREELTEAFNREFSENRTVEAIRSLAKKRRWPYKRAAHWAQGLRGESFKRHFTEDSMRRRTSAFVAMSEESRCRLGDVIVRHGVPYVVVSDDRNTHLENRIRRQDLLVWEQAHGSLAKGKILIHLDGDEFNNDLSNLHPLSISKMVLFGRWLLSEEGKKHKVMRETALKYIDLLEAMEDGRSNKQTGGD